MSNQAMPVAGGQSGESEVMALQQTASYLGISKAHLSNIINGKVPNVPVLRHARVGAADFD